MLSLAEQLRAAHVRRWHIVQVHREQTLAEHLFCVAAISGSLAERMQWPGFLHHSQRLQLLSWALWHDVMEVRTGDIPTPFKRAIVEANGPRALEKAEEMVDTSVHGMHRSIKNTEIEMIVKLADSIEAIQFLLDNGAGDHSRRVLDGLYETLFVQIRDFEVKYTTLPVYDAVRSVCKELNIWRAE